MPHVHLEALQQAEKQCAEAGAEAAQKQALMGQLMELEASMQKQGQLVEAPPQQMGPLTRGSGVVGFPEGLCSSEM